MDVVEPSLPCGGHFLVAAMLNYGQEERYVRISKLIITLASAVCLLGSSTLFADAAEPWHFSAQIGGYNLDSARDTSDGSVWGSVGFGRFLGNNFSVDFEYDSLNADFDNYNVVVPGATYDNWKLSTYGVMGRYYLGDKAWRPYIAAGLGRTKHRSVLDTDYATAISVGLGLKGQLARHWSVNAQVIWRQDGDGQSLAPRQHFQDMIYGLGLSYDFGGKEPAPAPAAPPPAPAPAAAPVNPDLDGDGVLNERDKCPNTRPGAVVDLDGCEVEAVISLEGVHFDFDKATLRPDAIVILDKAVGLLKSQERVVVEVAGHTDSVGSEEYNQSLSERRANSVKDYLISQGVSATRLTARGYGESQPVASNDTDAGRAQNRRVELIVLSR